MGKKIGVTGASGFIGNKLIEKLLNEGHQVTAFTRSLTPFSKKVKVVKGDLMDDKSVRIFLEEVDTVIHLAARQIPPESLFFRENVDATFNLVKNMIDFPINQFLFLSSVAVYGDQLDKVIAETDKCMPNTSYGLSKYLAENICMYWETVTGGKLTVLRPFNVYGKGSKIGVIYNMLKKVKEGESITLFGDGKQTRDFLYVEDVITAIITAVEKEQEGTFNLGTGIETTLLDLIEIIKKISPQKIKIAFERNEGDKAKKIAYSIEKAHSILGWQAKTSLEEGLLKIL